MKLFHFLLLFLSLTLPLAAWPPAGRAGLEAYETLKLVPDPAPSGQMAGVDQPLRFARPGEAVTFTLTLTNPNPVTNTYTVGATRNYGDEFPLIGLSRHPKYETYPHTSVEVAPGGQQTLELGVKIPGYATPGMVHRLETHISDSQGAASVELQLTTVVSIPTSIERVGHAGLAVEDVFIQGSYAYLAAGREGLRILDISDPVAPVEIGFYSPRDDPLWGAEQVTVQGNYAYVAAGQAGLRIIDLADPTRPVEVGYYSEPGYPSQVRLVGEVAYLVWQVCHYPPCSSHLHLVDVSNPANPVRVGLYEGIYEVDIAGTYAYLAAGMEGVRVLDVSNPVAPVEVVSQPIKNHSPQAIRVANGYAYVSSYYSLIVLDLAEPARPVEAGQISFFNYPATIAPLGPYLYLTDMNGNPLVVDLANPAQPVQVEGNYEVLRQAKAVAMAGETLAYLAAGPAGLRLVEVGQPASPNLVGVFGGPGYAQGVAVAGSYVYVADRYQGLRILDMTEPARPVEVGFYSRRGGAQQVSLQGNYAYAALGTCPAIRVERASPEPCQTGLYVLDVSDPAVPVEVAVYESWQEVKFWEDQAYVLDEAGILHLYDLSNPTAPVELKALDGAAGDFELANGYLYLLTPYSWHYTGDSNNPYASEGYLKILEAGSLAELSVTPLPEKNPAHTVAIAGPVAYIYWDVLLLDFYLKGSLALDISDPTAPVLIEGGYHPVEPQAARVAGRYAYLADGKAGLRVLDLANPASPIEVDSFGAEGLGLDIALAGGTIYLADGPAGLYILRYPGAE